MVDLTEVQVLDCNDDVQDQEEYQRDYRSAILSASTQPEVVARPSQVDTQEMFYDFVPSPEVVQAYQQQVAEQAAQGTEQATEVVQPEESSVTQTSPEFNMATAGSVDYGSLANMDIDEFLKDVINPPQVKIQDTSSFIRVEITRDGVNYVLTGPREKVQVEAMKLM